MHLYFLEFLSKNSNKQQKIAALKTLNSSQYKLLRQLTTDILKGKIPLGKQEYKKLLPHKIFIRKLSKGQVNKTGVSKNYSVVTELSKIYLKNNETGAKISAGTNRRMGKDKGKKGSKTKPPSKADSYSEDSESMETDYSSSEEQEGEGGEGEKEKSYSSGETEDEEEEFTSGEEGGEDYSSAEEKEDKQSENNNFKESD